MRRCPITYEPLGQGETYSPRGLRLLSPRLKALQAFPYDAAAQRREAVARAAKLSIQGVQPKLSAILSVAAQNFVLVDRGGKFILKPQSETFPQLPENEDLTMRMAAAAGIPVPFHGLLYCADGTLTYFISRFDRVGRGGKLALEDFAQLTGASRDTKYDSSMEHVAKVITKFCTFPLPQKAELFRRTIFAFLTGNEDMHLKNFSLLVQGDGTVALSPAYDLLNSTLVLARPREELALPIRGKKSRLTRADLVDYFGRDVLGLTPKTIAATLAAFVEAESAWRSLFDSCFLDETHTSAYRKLLAERSARLGI